MSPFLSSCAARVRLAFLLLTAVSGVCAQSSSGILNLEVRDQSGAHLVATGSIRSASGASSRAYTTDSQGAYSFTGLSLGRYVLSVTRDGFAPRSLSVDVGTSPVSQIVTLQLAAQASSVDVVAATPMAGTDLELNRIPNPVQAASAADIERTGSLDLADLFNKSLAAVNVTDNQGNPFQPDLNYRGYSASPLLGTPQGVSVYLDGVRQNQPLATWSVGT